MKFNTLFLLSFCLFTIINTTPQSEFLEVTQILYKPIQKIKKNQKIKKVKIKSIWIIISLLH